MANTGGKTFPIHVRVDTHSRRASLVDVYAFLRKTDAKHAGIHLAKVLRRHDDRCPQLKLALESGVRFLDKNGRPATKTSPAVRSYSHLLKCVLELWTTVYIDQYKVTTAGEHNQQVFRQQYVLLQHGLRDVIKDMWPTEDMSWPNLDQVHVGNACEREADVHGSPSSLPMPQPASSSIPPPAQGVPTFRTSNPASHPSENSSASTYGIPSESAALLKDASPSSSRSPRATLCMAPLAQGLPNDCILNQSSHPSEDSYASADAIASEGAPHSRDFGTLASEYQKQYGKPPTSGNCEWSQQQLRASFTEQPTHLRQATLIALQKACSLVPSATLSSDLCTI